MARPRRRPTRERQASWPGAQPELANPAALRGQWCSLRRSARGGDHGFPDQSSEVVMAKKTDHQHHQH
eukprot:4219898-Lingulodinium_polyedra.AAC.1